MDKNGRGSQGQDGMVAHTRPQVYVPAQLTYKLVYQQHELTHMGKTALEILLGLLLTSLLTSPHSVLLSPSDV